MPKRKAVSTKARKSCPAVRCNFRSSPTCIEAKDKNRAVVQHCITVLASNQSSRGDIAEHHKYGSNVIHVVSIGLAMLDRLQHTTVLVIPKF